MKKLIVAIIAFLYIGTSTGATVHLHYCMGKLVGWSLLHADDHDQCDKCGMSKSKQPGNGCCKDEHKLVKLEKDQRVRETITYTPIVIAATPPVLPDYSIIRVAATPEQYPVSNAPPGNLSQPRYLLNCIFRI